MQQNKQLGDQFNFRKKKDLPLRKEDQIEKRCLENKDDQVKLGWLKINPADIKFILDNPLTKQKCQSATELYLEFNQLGPKGVLEIAKANWKHIRFLNLSSNRISAKGVQYLTRGDWKQMESLGLMANQLMDEGVIHLQKGVWKELTILNISSNKISDRGIGKLVLGQWKNLVWIDLSLNRISENGISKMMLGEWHDLSNLPFSMIETPPRQLKIKKMLEEVLKKKFMQLEELEITFF